MSNALKTAHLRIARPTDRLDEIVDFYRTVLGFSVLSEFRDHDEFDGVMLGHSGAPYHLEFTSKAGHEVGRSPTEDILLVFYIPDRSEWVETISMIESQGYSAVKSFNPFWEVAGKTFEDPDGYRIVIQNSEWSR
ncbi:VOC family protein [Planctomicrobium sp.]|jgi:catechol 2,3-dioxygenase-like lactoylglutathione lyase family enzyme|nr:VOC family protein [Planctomicrobium sp.]MBT5017678.1 VOC family protein [Planctomicrobium sp.]MDB4743761.1 VOC family protein [Planctomicrobium sp.]